ncbi:calcium-dependent protein kinase 5-like [Dreissena polymorpha]|uniref:Protein kinase domain-containing protein n=1 Tax=Dreissena polymorpha TaxID=45954 RepID=A0A9D4L337_DREPO|nr:calcium-dependent protein kinase 5-like [Dreissena polymorpha]XP_052275064.1 calcium-dependent protein kinase 5-like [Dreissena polymorpha]XP_052275065.1 calcium-dependent protein kinase 5-like [Dreissena polymorpha]KAH3851045.1 hypothetical protein DPMN_093523 [Dreissena polymorpha]
MPRSYVDNAYNRSVGRVGMPVGSMVISKGSGSGGLNGSSGFGSSGGSALFASGYSDVRPSSAMSSRTYVDNAYNRSVGRVGMPMGSMPISKSSGGGGGHSSSRSTKVTISESYACPSKTYVDNAYNQSAGRVGMPVGSMPISKTEERPLSAKNEIRSGSSNSSTSTKTYVDNSYNRSAGRVGMPVGSMPISKNDTTVKSSSVKYESRSDYDDSSTKTYVDNASNRRMGRAGMPIGSMVMSNNSPATELTPGIACSTKSKVYVDNESNRRLGRVGLPLGTAVVSPKIRMYTDNAQNRKLGRVGKPIGTMVFHKKDKTVTMQTYIDSKVNRDHERVGLPRGCMPRSRKVSKETEKTRDIVKRHTDENGDFNYSDSDLGDYRPDNKDPISDDRYDDIREMAELQFMNIVWRQRAETAWYDEHGAEAITTDQLPEVDDIIPYSELKLCEKIGEGGFAVVFLAEWRDTPVAVKEMKTGKITRKKVDLFNDEMKLFRSFDHQNIVRYIGACEEPEHLCIVMEYMKECLFNVIHVNDAMTAMDDQQRLVIIRQICLGMVYLHGKNVAHCDLKSQNILMTTASNGDTIVKISDFGLSMVRKHTETSSTASVTMVSGKGTPRYSAPEVLRGERLKASDMMRTDIWSLALIVFEIVYEEEPYPDFNLMQLQKQVGEKGCAPEVPEGVDVNPDIRHVMDDALQLLPEKRPDISQFKDVFVDACYIFVK